MSQLDDFTFDFGAMLGLVLMLCVPVGIVALFWFGHWAIALTVCCMVGIMFWADESASRMPK